MRALDYNINDLLYEPRDCIKEIIEDLSTTDNYSSQQLLKYIDLVYTTIHHTYPTLIGTTNLAPHNLRFSIGNIAGRATIGVCEICARTLQFFMSNCLIQWMARLVNVMQTLLNIHSKEC